MASTVMQLSRRLGAARVALVNVDGLSPRHAAISNIQKTAVQELLSDAMAQHHLTSEEIARLSDLILEIGWAPGPAGDLLRALSQKSVPKRRKQQDFRALTSYLGLEVFPESQQRPQRQG